jgi:hypothetical protein
MRLNSQLRFSGRAGVTIALAGMFLLEGTGAFLLVHDLAVNNPLFFATFGADEAAISGRIWLFFLLRFVAQIPALTFAAGVVALSDLRHPVRTAFWIALGLHLFLHIWRAAFWLIGARAASWPWSAIPGLDQRIPVLAECVSLVMIVGCIVLLTWLALICVKRYRQLAGSDMNAIGALRHHSVYRDALICQLVAVVLASMTIGPECFLALALPVWVLYWVGLAFYVKLRVAPTKPELFLARVAPLFVFVVVFVIGQYL